MIRTLLVKLETEYGVDASPIGALDAILATDLKLSPMKGVDLPRDYSRPYFSAAAAVPVGLHATIVFRVDLKGSGQRGLPPAVSPLLKACNYRETINPGASVTYAPHSGEQDSCTLHFNDNGTLYRLTGARGTWRYRLTATGVGGLEFEMTGLFSQPTNAVPTSVAFGAQMTVPALFTNFANMASFMIGETVLTLREFNFDAGNELTPRFLSGGSRRIGVTNSRASATATINTTPLATFNPFALAAEQERCQLTLTHGHAIGGTCNLSLPAIQVMRPPDLETQDDISLWRLRLIPLPVIGDDQAALIFT